MIWCPGRGPRKRPAAFLQNINRIEAESKLSEEDPRVYYFFAFYFLQTLRPTSCPLKPPPRLVSNHFQPELRRPAVMEV